MPPFWVGFSKQRKKPGWRRSSNCVQNAFFQLSPSGRNGKTPLGSQFYNLRFHATILGWAFLKPSGKSRGMETKVVPITIKTVFFQLSPIGAKVEKTPLGSQFYNLRFQCHHFPVGFSKSPAEECRHVTEGRPIAFKMVFFQLRPDRGETLKNTRWDRNFTTFGFNATIFRWAFPSPAEKCRHWNRRSSNCVQNACFSTFRPDRGESWKNTLGIAILQPSVSCHHFPVGFSKPTGKSRHWNEGRSIAFKTRVFQRFAPIGAKSEKHPLGSNFTTFGFMPPFSAGLFQAQRKKPALKPKVVQLR